MLQYNWKNPEKSIPLCYKTGHWDGKLSDEVLVLLDNGNFEIAVVYEGILDGSKFVHWYRKDDFELEGKVVAWKDLEYSWDILKNLT